MTYEPIGRDQTRPAERSPGDSDDLVERLVRLAEPGPQPPPHGAQLVKDALRGSWRAEVSRRRRRRALYWAVGSLTAAALVALAVTALLADRTTSPPTGGPVGRIAAIRGSVQLVPPAGGPARTLGTDARDALPAGSRLMTGPGGLVAIVLPHGASLRLDSSSSVRLPSAQTTFLDRGTVYVDSQGNGDAVTVSTEFGVVREIGTQFEVRHGGQSLRVRVREGAVRLSGRDEQLEVRAGTSLEVHSDGSATRSSIGPGSPEWNWILAVAPPLDIEGRSADDFLHWAARETGLSLEYDDPATATLARGCILHGSLTGLTPAEAPAVVLPSCGLAHRIDQGRLIVEAQTGQTPAAEHPAGAT